MKLYRTTADAPEPRYSAKVFRSVGQWGSDQTRFRRYIAEIFPGEYQPDTQSNRPSRKERVPKDQTALADRSLRLVTKTCIRCHKPFTVPSAHQDRRKHCSVTCCALDRRLFEVTAEELYALVWSQPTTEVARLFGVSDKAIEKRCKRLGIPKPPRGYWLQVNRNQRPTHH